MVCMYDNKQETGMFIAWYGIVYFNFIICYCALHLHCMLKHNSKSLKRFLSHDFSAKCAAVPACSVQLNRVRWSYAWAVTFWLVGLAILGAPAVAGHSVPHGGSAGLWCAALVQSRGTKHVESAQGPTFA